MIEVQKEQTFSLGITVTVGLKKKYNFMQYSILCIYKIFN